MAIIEATRYTSPNKNKISLLSRCTLAFVLCLNEWADHFTFPFKAYFTFVFCLVFVVVISLSVVDI